MQVVLIYALIMFVGWVIWRLQTDKPESDAVKYRRYLRQQRKDEAKYRKWWLDRGRVIKPRS